MRSRSARPQSCWPTPSATRTLLRASWRATCRSGSFATAPRATGPSFEALLGQGSQDVGLPIPSRSDPSVIFFTSGSTGKPKGVTHSFETVGWLLAAWLKGYEMTADDVMLPGSSISHIGGYGHSFGALAAGARVLVARTFDGDELLPLLRQHRPTVLFMLPAALITLVREHGATRDDFGSLRLCLSGGDKVAAELEREFTDLAGFPIDEIYGMSEIGVSNLNPPMGINKLGSIGPANAGYALSNRDESGRELPVGQEGRLWVKSPCNMVGYWNRPDATEETIKDGWLDTGDVMKADQDGYLWFCGRKKADHHPRRLQHLPPGGRGSAARARRGGQRRGRGHP
jgi:long-chain acyl-CoA synthetase